MKSLHLPLQYGVLFEKIDWLRVRFVVAASPLASRSLIEAMRWGAAAPHWHCRTALALPRSRPSPLPVDRRAASCGNTATTNRTRNQSIFSRRTVHMRKIINPHLDSARCYHENSSSSRNSDLASTHRILRSSFEARLTMYGHIICYMFLLNS